MKNRDMECKTERNKDKECITEAGSEEQRQGVKSRDITLKRDPSRMATYLQMAHRSLRRARRLTTQMRLNSLPLSTVRKNYVGTPEQLSGGVCEKCDKAVEETVQHVLRDCPAYKEERDAFFARVRRVAPGLLLQWAGDEQWLLMLCPEVEGVKHEGQMELCEAGMRAVEAICVKR